MMSRFPRGFLVLVAALAAFALGGVPAEAHPLGDPQQAELSLTDERTVAIHWKAPSDDLAWLALELGLLPDGRILLDGAVLFEEGDNKLLAEAPEFEEYLRERIAVSQPAGVCPPAVSDRADVGTRGVTMTFACAEPVTTLDVTVTTLTDLDPRYTTQVTSSDGTTVLYDATNATHEWNLTGLTSGEAGHDPGTPQAIVGWVVLGVAVVLVLVGAGLLWRRRGRVADRGKR